MLSFKVADFEASNSERLVGSDWAAFEPGSGSFYVCGFVKLESLTTCRPVICKASDSLSTLEWSLFIGGTGHARFYVASAGVYDAASTVVSTGAISAGEWAFVEAAYSADDDVLIVCLTPCSSESLAEVDVTSWSGSIGATSFALQIGGDGTNFFDGQMHSVLYSTTIPEPDVRLAIFNEGTGQLYGNLPDGITPVAFWELNEESGTRYDSGDGDYDLTDTNTVSSTDREINVVASPDQFEVDEAIYRHFKNRRLQSVFTGIVDDGDLEDDAVRPSDLALPYVKFRTVTVDPSFSNVSQFNDAIVQFEVFAATKSACRDCTRKMFAAFAFCDLPINSGEGSVPLFRPADVPIYRRESPQVWKSISTFRVIHESAVDLVPVYHGET